MSSRLLTEACHDRHPSPYLYGEGGLVHVKNTFVHLPAIETAMEMEKTLRRCSSSPTMCSESQAASFFNGDCLNRNSDHDSTGKFNSDNLTSLASAEDREDSPSSQGSGPLPFSMASEPESECEAWEIQELDEQSEARWNQEENGDPALVAERRAEAKAAMQLAHPEGRCKPCLYFAFKEDGCRAGSDCTYCHECSREDILARRKMHKREARAAAQANRRLDRNVNAQRALARKRAQRAAAKRSSSEQMPRPTPVGAEGKTLEVIAVALKTVGRCQPYPLPTVFTKAD